MNSLLTPSFLAWRTRPRARTSVTPAPTPAPVLGSKGPYPHCGYLSNLETRTQRVQRLSDAFQEGYTLSAPDLACMHQGARQAGGPQGIGNLNRSGRKQGQRAEWVMRQRLAESAPLSRG